MPRKKKTTEAVEILDRRYREQVPGWDEEVAKEEMRVKVGITVINLRNKAKMTQQQLADRMGITQSMLSQIENGNYDGSVLDMLWRTCLALGMHLDLCCREPNTQQKVCDVTLATSHV
jgi:DNA-binding XRE family transcriptional regulator